ncbi:MAG: AEC family transporter [Comamonadaceae bacterium]|jgi:malonate transporter|nr:AEC family transporter [Comamonadaceae bacterium]
MNGVVLDSLAPVVLLIGSGYLAGRLGWMGQASVKDLTNLIFFLLTPALLFRTMSRVHVEQLEFMPVAAYFLAAGLLFGATLLLQGFSRRSAVLALAGTFSNTVMIGIALINLLFGAQGLVTLLTLVSIHALVLLTLSTLVLEVAQRRDQAGTTDAGASKSSTMRIVMQSFKSTVFHPVPLPILLGLLYAQTGWGIASVIDKPLALLGSALSPLALVLVGVSLAYTSVGQHWRGALALAGVKNLVHPLLVWALCLLMGVDGLPMTVMVVTAALPIGANVFLFSQRYQVAQELVTASVAMSSMLAMVTLTATLAIMI